MSEREEVGDEGGRKDSKETFLFRLRKFVLIYLITG